MEVFRIQENVPDVYSRKSRDFQLLCNLFDYVNNGVKFDIDSIVDVTDTNLCSDRLLPYLQTKLGFFTNTYINSTSQRIILKAFPYLIKNKGSIKGIVQAIHVFLKTQGVDGEVSVQNINTETSIDSKTHLNILNNVFRIDIGICTRYLDVQILKEILRYIIPTGYTVKYTFTEEHLLENEMLNKDTVNIVFVKSSVNDGIRIYGEADNTAPLNIVGTSIVASSNINEISDIENKGTPDNVTDDNDYSITILEDN